MTIGKLAYSTALPSSPPLSGFDPFFFPICPTRIVLQRVLGGVTVGAAVVALCRILTFHSNQILSEATKPGEYLH